MTVDTKRCVGCNSCVIACKQENRLPPGATRDWIVTETQGIFPALSQEIRSERCNHCSKSPCVSACPTGASYVSTGGIVLVNHDKCTGCKACIAACPYEARYVHPKGHVDKCTFCIHRVQKGGLPACVETCPTKALRFGDLNDSESEVARLLSSREWKTLNPGTGARPNVYFLI
ncbi:MAG: tetrathionate reductase [Bdellovibrionales bacterium GWB1_55_8]|nr:MAG: tetrathionate reductase [Bdellovibrionales bacterium GWB1_55_8]